MITVNNHSHIFLILLLIRIIEVAKIFIMIIRMQPFLPIHISSEYRVCIFISPCLHLSTIMLYTFLVITSYLSYHLRFSIIHHKRKIILKHITGYTLFNSRLINDDSISLSVAINATSLENYFLKLCESLHTALSYPL